MGVQKGGSNFLALGGKIEGKMGNLCLSNVINILAALLCSVLLKEYFHICLQVTNLLFT